MRAASSSPQARSRAPYPPALRTSTRAFSSTAGPREVFIRYAVGFINDSAWTQQLIDITAYKNNALKVRFLLAELGLEYERKLVPIERPRPEWYAAINPPSRFV